MTTKHDGGKDRWDLLPLRAVREVVRVLTFGCAKYAAWNWVTVPDARERYKAALDRHVAAWWCDGEALDEESGLHHLAHAATDVLFLLALEIGDTTGRLHARRCPLGSSSAAHEPTFGDQISEAAKRVFEEVTARREELLRAWVAETGVNPSEAELVEVRDASEGPGRGDLVRIYVRRRAKPSCPGCVDTCPGGEACPYRSV